MFTCNGNVYRIDDDLFPEVTFENSTQKVKLELKNLKLKEKGFDIPCEMYYHIHDDIEDSIMSLESTGGWCDFYNSKNRYRCAAPTIYQTLKWLREEKRIEANGCYDNNEQGWMGYVCEMDVPDLYAFHALKVHHKSYEEAALSAIEYVLDNNLINKKI